MSSRIGGQILLAGVYFGAAKLGLMLAGPAEQVSAVWPPTGVATAAVLIFGYRMWPGILLGAFLANATANEPMATAVGIAIGNTLEAVVGSWLLLWWIGFDKALERIRDVLGLIVLAAGVSTTISATLGVTSLCLGGVHPWSEFGSLWIVWWIGDAMGDLVVAPPLLVSSLRFRSIQSCLGSSFRWVEATALALGTAAVALLVFSGLAPTDSLHYLAAYAVFPFVIWAALRFGQPGTTCVTLATSIIAVVATTRGMGRFGSEPVEDRLISLQVFMGVVAVTGLILAAALSERRKNERRWAVLHGIAQVLSASPTLARATPLIVQRICEDLTWQVGAIWQVAEESSIARCAEFWSAESFPAFEATTRQRTFERGVGLPGRVWASGKPAWIPDVTCDANFPRAAAAHAEGLHSAFGFPIMLNDQVLGVMEFFSHEIRQPDPSLLDSMAAIGIQIGQFIERRRAEEGRRQSEQRLASELEAVQRLHALSSRLLSTENLAAGLADVLSNAMAACGAAFGTVQLLNERTGALEIIAQQGFDQEFLDYFAEVRVDDDLACAQALRRGERIHVEDVAGDPGLKAHWTVLASAGVRAVQSTPLVTSDGRPIGVVSTHFNSSRRLAERDERLLDLYAGHAADLIQRHRLEQALKDADRRKDEFLATLAHELRNPLAPIRNGLQIMELAKGDPEKVEEARAMMDRQVGQMVHLVDDLLDLSRITRGTIVLRKQRVDLGTIVRQAVETSRAHLDEAGHCFTVDMAAETLYLDADATRLAQVLSNLLNNACKYTDRGGQIRLSVERQHSEAIVSVKDNGIGIPPDLLPNVFDIFTQVDRDLEKSRDGLGIGLSIVKQLVELHGGAVEARSRGRALGSEFIVRLPLAPVPTLPATAVETPVRPSVNRRVLVVDDNRDSATSLAAMLRIMGNESRTANDGWEALEVAAEFHPDLVLLDIGMPILDGYETARRIRQQPWGRSMTLVALTGWGEGDDRRKSQEAGFDLHVVKPIERTVLERVLASAAPAPL